MSRLRSAANSPNASSAIATTAIGKAADESPDTTPYIGRFAPSPTGPLHFGSLLAALASCLQARANNGTWLVRIEDVDPPREKPGSDRLILAALERFGFDWDGDVIYQSKQGGAHRDALNRLLDEGLAYPCTCSRRDIADCPTGPLGPIYPGTCRSGCGPGESAIRVLTHSRRIEFDDGIQGLYGQTLETESGDFIVWRRDGLVAYHLAVVVDDALQGITEIVRGIDLLDSTPRQIHLQQLLGFPTPAYMHIPVAMDDEGNKLSKATRAAAIDEKSAAPTLVAALAALRQEPPADLAEAGLNEIWQWAETHWRPEQMAGIERIRNAQDSMLQRENRLS